MRVEEVIETYYICSLGSFQLEDNKVVWKVKKRLNLSLNNIERKISLKEAKKILNEYANKIL